MLASAHPTSDLVWAVSYVDVHDRVAARAVARLDTRFVGARSLFDFADTHGRDDVPRHQDDTHAVVRSITAAHDGLDANHDGRNVHYFPRGQRTNVVYFDDQRRSSCATAVPEPQNADARRREGTQKEKLVWPRRPSAAFLCSALRAKCEMKPQIKSYIREGDLDREAAVVALRKWLEGILPQTGFALKYEIRSAAAAPVAGEYEHPEVTVTFSGPDESLLLEHGAELLLALEYLAVRSLRLDPPHFDRIRFDAGGYRALRI